MVRAENKQNSKNGNFFDQKILELFLLTVKPFLILVIFIFYMRKQNYSRKNFLNKMITILSLFDYLN